MQQGYSHTDLECQRLRDIIRNSKNAQAPNLTSEMWINQYPCEDIGASLIMPHINVLMGIFSLQGSKSTLSATRFHRSGEMKVNLAKEQLAGDAR